MIRELENSGKGLNFVPMAMGSHRKILCKGRDRPRWTFWKNRSGRTAVIEGTIEKARLEAGRPLGEPSR